MTNDNVAVDQVFLEFSIPLSSITRLTLRSTGHQFASHFAVG